MSLKFTLVGKIFLHGFKVGQFCYFLMVILGYHGNGYPQQPTFSVIFAFYT